MDSVAEQLKNPLVITLAAFIFLAIFLASRRSNAEASAGTIQRIGPSEELEKAVLEFELQKAGMISGFAQNLYEMKFQEQELEKQRAFELQALQLQLQTSKDIAEIESRIEGQRLAFESQRLAAEMDLARQQMELQRYAIKKASKKNLLSRIFSAIPETLRIFGGLGTVPIIRF